jgi:hypothetical protein
MSLDQENTVDAVGIEPATEYVVLTITDAWGWDDETAHLLALQKKLNAYFDFVSSGQLLQAYPKATGRRVRIDVIGKYRIPESASAFFEQAKSVAARIGSDLMARNIE